MLPAALRVGRKRIDANFASIGVIDATTELSALSSFDCHAATCQWSVLQCGVEATLESLARAVAVAVTRTFRGCRGASAMAGSRGGSSGASCSVSELEPTSLATRLQSSRSMW